MPDLRLGVLLAFAVAGAPRATAAGELAVSTDFPGGAALVEGIDQDRRLVRVSPPKLKNRGWMCWWYFELSGIEPGETLVLDVGNSVWATPTHAFYSTDGTTWQQTPRGKRNGRRIVYRLEVEAERAWFAWGPPFTPKDARQLVDRLAKRSPHAEAFELCRTREGRSTPALRVRQDGVDDEQRYGIWIQARQHAWESGSSWVGRGFAEWLVSDDADAERLRRTALVTFVPVMDVDNVAVGAGGKQQQPWDHNRDWTDEPHWRSVAAAQHAIRKLDADGRFDVFVDLHNPDPASQRPFYMVTPGKLLSDLGRRNLERFVDATREEMTGELALSDKLRVSGARYDRKWQAISKNWVNTHTREHVVAVTLETAWNTPHSTPAGYQRVGRHLGEAIARYLTRDPRAAE